MFLLRNKKKLSLNCPQKKEANISRALGFVVQN